LAESPAGSIPEASGLSSTSAKDRYGPISGRKIRHEDGHASRSCCRCRLVGATQPPGAAKASIARLAFSPSSINVYLAKHAQYVDETRSHTISSVETEALEPKGPASLRPSPTEYSSPRRVQTKWFPSCRDGRHATNWLRWSEVFGGAAEATVVAISLSLTHLQVG
jgi:hypothetical protein